jgi:hypothetical protein
MEPFVVCHHCGDDHLVGKLLPKASYESNDRNEDILTFTCPSCKRKSTATIHLRPK